MVKSEKIKIICLILITIAILAMAGVYSWKSYEQIKIDKEWNEVFKEKQFYQKEGGLHGGKKGYPIQFREDDY